MVKHCRAKDSSMLDVNDCSMLDYASGSQGYEPLREAIAGYLRHARAVKCGADQVVIVNGAQQAIDLIAKLLIDRGSPAPSRTPATWARAGCSWRTGPSCCPRL